MNLAALLVLGMGLVACQPQPPAIGPGCQFGRNATQVLLNHNANGWGDDSTNWAAGRGAELWNEAGTKAPRVANYWPTPSAAGKGNFEVRNFNNNHSNNSGYVSTVGPPGKFQMPTCGQSSWSTKPHIWLNEQRMAQYESAGRFDWMGAVGAHEIGHALGLDHTTHTDCGLVVLMESKNATLQRCKVHKPTGADSGAVNALYN